MITVLIQNTILDNNINYIIIINIVLSAKDNKNNYLNIQIFDRMIEYIINSHTKQVTTYTFSHIDSKSHITELFIFLIVNLKYYIKDDKEKYNVYTSYLRFIVEIFIELFNAHNNNVIKHIINNILTIL